MVSVPSQETALATRAVMLVVIAWLLFLIPLFLWAVDAFVQMPRRDSGANLYVAQGMLEGETPYLDRWAHKGPLIYVLNAIGLLLSEAWGVWLVELGFLAGTCLAAGKLLCSRFGTVAGLFSLTALLFYFAKVVQGGNYTEQYALMLQFMALALFARVEGQDEELGRSTKFLLILGALGGAAFMLRPNLIGIWVAIGLVWTVQRDDMLRKVGWATAGGLAVLVVVIAWFALAGGLSALSALWDAVIFYNVNYSNDPLASRAGAVRATFEWFFPLTWVLLLAWSIGLWQTFIWERGEPRRPLVRLAVVLLPVEVVFANLSGHAYGHYYLALLPVVCLLSAFAAGSLLDTFRVRHPWIPIALFVLTGFTCVMRSNLIPADVEKYWNLQAYAERGDALVDHIREHTEDGEAILIWGAESQYYVRSDRPAPTRFFFGYPLVKPGYGSPELIAEFTADVVANPPVLIIDSQNALLPSLDRKDRERRRDGSPDQFRRFFEFVDGEYQRVRTIGTYDVYRRKP